MVEQPGRKTVTTHGLKENPEVQQSGKVMILGVGVEAQWAVLGRETGPSQVRDLTRFSGPKNKKTLQALRRSKVFSRVGGLARPGSTSLPRPA